MMPPVAVVRANGSRPQSSAILSVSADFLAVIVNDSQEVFSQPGVNTSGRPKLASLAASERHRFQQPPCSLVTTGAAVVMEPYPVHSVREPLVTSTRSRSATSMVSGTPSRSSLMPVTTLCPSVRSRSRSSTLQPYSKRTPLAASASRSGLMKASYWLYLQNFTTAMSLKPQKQWRKRCM